MPCNPNDLADIKLFELLDRDEITELAGVIDQKRLDGSEILFSAGDPGESLYVIKTGAVELFIIDNSGQKIVLKEARTNDIFGELSMLDNRPRSASAVAIEPTELLVLDRNDLLLLFQKKPDTGLNMLASMGEMLRDADNLLRTRVSRNVNDEMEEKLPALVRIADWIAWFSGSMQFLIINALIFIVWISVNVISLGVDQFDPFPFGLLTMIVSLEAIFLSCFVLISQNRQSEKDHIRSDVEYEINIKAELEIAYLHEKTDRIQERMHERFDMVEKLFKNLKT